MNWDVRVTSNARRDRDRAVAWFDEHRPWLSEDFIADYFRTLHRVELEAGVPAPTSRGFRRFAFDTFRYHMWYRIMDGSNIVYVLVVNYQGRDPELIEERLRAEP